LREVSHVPRSPTTGFVFKRLLNAIRPRGVVGPVVPGFPFTLFFSSVEPADAYTLEPPPTTTRAAFLEYLQPTVEIQDYESFPTNTQFCVYPGPSPTLTLNGVGMTIPMPELSPGVPFYAPVEAAFTIASLTQFDRWNTTIGGANFLQNCQTPLIASFPTIHTELVFSPSIAFFGAYFTDFGDWNDSWIIMRLVADNDTFTDHFMGSGLGQGSLTFWGFASNDGLLYKRIEFYNFGPNIDGFGIDDITFGPVSGQVGPP
jgi:hypothetical protein